MSLLNKFFTSVTLAATFLVGVVPWSPAEAAVSTGCRCSARLTLGKPMLQWRDGALVFTPVVNVRIRSRGSERTPWTARVESTGESNYSSEDVTAPAGIGFNQSKDIWQGTCGDNISFSGWQLQPVTLSGLSQGLTQGQRIDGVVKMRATLSSCETDEEYRQFRFSLRDWGNLFVRSWSSVRG